MSNMANMSKHGTEPVQPQADTAIPSNELFPSPSRKRTSSNAADGSSTIVGRLRSASQSIFEANVPGGMWSATGAVVSKAPTLPEIRAGDYGARRESDTVSPVVSAEGQSLANASENRSDPLPSSDKISDVDDGLPANLFGRPEIDGQSYVRGQRTSVVGRVPKLAIRRRNSQEALGAEDFQDAVEEQNQKTTPAQNSSLEAHEAFTGLDEESDLEDLYPKPKRHSKNIDAMLGRTPVKPISAADKADSEPGDLSKPVPNAEGVYPNGYSFPKPKPWTEATMIGFKAFLRFTFTPLGFLIVLYGLNVVAWGGMLFLLLCNASPAMCQLGDGTYDCNDINSPRRVWVEIDSQILNALFCVTGFGLIPWRFRDFYYLLKWRIGNNKFALRKLAGYHNGWFRLPNSDHLPVKDFRESELESDIVNPSLPLPLKKTPGPPLTGARAPPTALWKLDFVIWAFVWNTFLQAVLSGFMWGLNRYNRPSWSTGLFVALACIVAAMGGLMQFLEGKKIKGVEGVPLEVEQEYKDVEKGMKKKEGKGNTNTNH